MKSRFIENLWCFLLALTKGINENWNGFLRRGFPKSTDFTKISRVELADDTQKINI